MKTKNLLKKNPSNIYYMKSKDSTYGMKKMLVEDKRYHDSCKT
jgi:hypothetical protein